MGIHRINWCILEEFNSPGDLRFRIETDIRISPEREDPRFTRSLREAVESSRHEVVRDLLLERLGRPLRRARDKSSKDDLVRVRRLVNGALSNPKKPVPPEGSPPGGSRPGAKAR